MDIIKTLNDYWPRIPEGNAREIACFCEGHGVSERVFIAAVSAYNSRGEKSPPPPRLKDILPLLSSGGSGKTSERRQLWGMFLRLVEDLGPLPAVRIYLNSWDESESALLRDIGINETSEPYWDWAFPEADQWFCKYLELLHGNSDRDPLPALEYAKKYCGSDDDRARYTRRWNHLRHAPVEYRRTGWLCLRDTGPYAIVNQGREVQPWTGSYRDILKRVPRPMGTWSTANEASRQVAAVMDDDIPF